MPTMRNKNQEMRLCAVSPTRKQEPDCGQLPISSDVHLFSCDERGVGGVGDGTLVTYPL